MCMGLQVEGIGVHICCMKESLCVWGCRCWYEHLLYEGICVYGVAGVGVHLCCMKKSVFVWGCMCWCEHLLYEEICVCMGLQVLV